MVKMKEGDTYFVYPEERPRLMVHDTHKLI